MKNANSAPVRSHFLRNFLIVFIAALTVVGLVLASAVMLTNAKTYARYGGAIADKAAYSYLASNYKFNFCRSLTAQGITESETLWETKPEGSDKTYGALLEEGTKEYIARVLVSAALFDSAATAKEKKEAKAAAKTEELKMMIERMRVVLGTQVSLIGNDKKGRIYIDYHSPETLLRIEEMLGIQDVPDEQLSFFNDDEE